MESVAERNARRGAALEKELGLAATVHASADFPRFPRTNWPSDVRKRDLAFLKGGAVDAMVHTYDDLPVPTSMYHPQHAKQFEELERTERRVLRAWIASTGHVLGNPITHFDRRVVYDPTGTRIKGFDYLNVQSSGGHDYPTLLDEAGSHGPYSTYSTFAFMLQSNLFRHVSPNIELHVLTKGVQTYYDKGLGPSFKPPGSAIMATPTPLVHYVHTTTNMEAYMDALVQSEAFLHAAQSTSAAPLRRIVVPVQLTGHFVLLVWDHTAQKDRIFVMTSAPQQLLPHDASYADNLSRGFMTALQAHGFITTSGPHVQVNALPPSAPKMRAMSRRDEYLDTDCFYLSMLYAFYLATVADTFADDGEAFVRPETWNMIRAAYNKWEVDTLEFLSHAIHEQALPVLLGPEWAQPFLDIRNASLYVPGIGYFQYEWDRGWHVVQPDTHTASSQ
jgi:hypothetical protein